MAIQISGNTIITDTRELRKCLGTDERTNISFADALRQDNLYIRILDSSGNEIHRIWGGTP